MAWVVIGIIWLWGTMLVAIFAPLLDGGIQQILQVYRGLTGKPNPHEDLQVKKKDADTSASPSQSGGSIIDDIQGKESTNRVA